MISLVPVATVLASETARSARPAAVLDTHDDMQRNYWANRLHVSSDDLNAAVEAVGPSIAAIRRHLGK